MESKMRKCAVCRSEYSYCPRCNEDKMKPMWYFTFCSSNCKDIYETTSRFENRQISMTEAKKTLNKLDLSKSDSFGASYKSSIEKINTVKEAIVVIEEVEQVQEFDEEEKEIKKPKRAKRNVE